MPHTDSHQEIEGILRNIKSVTVKEQRELVTHIKDKGVDIWVMDKMTELVDRDILSKKLSIANADEYDDETVQASQQQALSDIEEAESETSA